MEWYRWWHGAAHDPKFQMVAKESGVPLAQVLGLWAYLLETASQTHPRGSLAGLDLDVVAFHLGIDVVTPCNAMKRRGLLHETEGALHVTNWGKRQPKREREDDSSERVRACRERKKSDVTPCNATLRQETPREEKRREEVNPPLAPPVDSETPAPRKRVADSQATRLPEDWVLPKAWGEWALSEQRTWTPDHVRKVAVIFADHWRSQPPPRARKTDWEATWRNWVRREGPLPINGSVPKAGSPFAGAI